MLVLIRGKGSELDGNAVVEAPFVALVTPAMSTSHEGLEATHTHTSTDEASSVGRLLQFQTLAGEMAAVVALNPCGGFPLRRLYSET